MNIEGYLVISNVITGMALLLTCTITLCRRKDIRCPYCNAPVYQYELRQHIEQCIRPISPVPVVASPAEQLYAVAVPLPPPYYGNTKVADI